MPDWYERMTPGTWLTFSDLPGVQYSEIIELVSAGKLEVRHDTDEGIYYFRKTGEAVNGVS